MFLAKVFVTIYCKIKNAAFTVAAIVAHKNAGIPEVHWYTTGSADPEQQRGSIEQGTRDRLILRCFVNVTSRNGQMQIRRL